MSPQVDKRATLDILQTLDSYLEKYERKFPIYLMGGSALILRDVQEDSKDADFITNSNGYLALGEAVERLEKERGIRIDYFKDGRIISYRYEDYYLRAEKVRGLRLKHLDVYVLDFVNIILTKALSGRESDMQKILELKRRGITAPRDELERRFQRVVPNRGKEKEIKERFENFLQAYYADQKSKGFKTSSS